MAVQSPSSIKQLFPSISIFNLAADPQPLMSPIHPPPQFAVDYDPNRFKKQIKRICKRSLQEAYPSAFKTFLFDDAQPGTPAQGIRPVCLLIERLEAWYILAKRLLHHFEFVASVETRVGKQYRKLEGVMIFPSPGSDIPQYYQNRWTGRREQLWNQKLLQVHFAFTGGVRSVCDAWQMYHMNAANDHAEFATFLRSKAVSTLSNIKQELKWMIKSIRSDDRLSLATLTCLKKEASKRLKKLDKQLIFFDKHPFYGYTKKDPWLMNASVVKQMIKVYRQENIVHETVLRLQKEILISEEQLVEEFRHLCQQIYSMREQSSLGVDRGLDSIMKAFNAIKMDSDWLNFCQQNSEHLISEKAAYRHPEFLQYPNHTHVLLQPIFAARMERRSTVFHQWHEHIYVLTPAGFLHEYRDVKNYPAKPDGTIFVPHYKVSTLSTNIHHNLIFQLQPHAASRNMLNGYAPALPKDWRTSKPRLGLRDRFTWTLRAKSAVDMERWVKDLTSLSERYRTVPVVCMNHDSTEEIPVTQETEDAEVENAKIADQEEPNVVEEAKEEEMTLEEPTKEEQKPSEELPIAEESEKELLAVEEPENKEETSLEDPTEENITDPIPVSDTLQEEESHS
ncbi:hypothetical protein G6F23_005897 [Rhizopus arrhizus]|nr:hypothetical protein G6F23_005897 [Rhizopus arrhizus]